MTNYDGNFFLIIYQCIFYIEVDRKFVEYKMHHLKRVDNQFFGWVPVGSVYNKLKGDMLIWCAWSYRLRSLRCWQCSIFSSAFPFFIIVSLRLRSYAYDRAGEGNYSTTDLNNFPKIYIFVSWRAVLGAYCRYLVTYSNFHMNDTNVTQGNKSSKSN